MNDKIHEEQIEKYVPCRIMEIYFDKDGEIEIGSFKLKGLGRDIWLMLDGKHTIGDIVDNLCIKLETRERNAVKCELLTVLKMLKTKELIVANWNPLYKLLKGQEL